MSDKWHNLFHRDEYPHDDLLTRYIMDELSADERHQVERHALDCPSCSDALEGLQQHHTTHGNTAAHLASLGEKIDAHVNARNKGRNWLYWSAAASLTVLLAVAWWVWSNGPSEHVFAEKAPTQEETQTAAKGQAAATDSVAFKYKTPEQPKKAEAEIANVSKLQSNNAVLDEDLIGSDTVFGSGIALRLEGAEAIADNDSLILYSEELTADQEELEVLDIAEDKAMEMSQAYYSNGLTKNEEFSLDIINADSILEGSVYDRNDGRSLAAAPPLHESVSLERKQLQSREAGTINADAPQIAEAREPDPEPAAAREALGDALDDQQFAASEARQREEEQDALLQEVEKADLRVGNRAYSPPAASGFREAARAATNPVESAKTLYDRGKYAEALKQLQPFTHPQSVDSKALFYAGRCHFELGNAQAAIPLLDRVIKLGEPAFYEGALWFKANALVRKGDTSRAILVLDQLLPLGGTYQRQALQLREQLSR